MWSLFSYFGLQHYSLWWVRLIFCGICYGWYTLPFLGWSASSQSGCQLLGVIVVSSYCIKATGNVELSRRTLNFVCPARSPNLKNSLSRYPITVQTFLWSRTSCATPCLILDPEPTVNSLSDKNWDAVSFFRNASTINVKTTAEKAPNEPRFTIWSTT